MCGGGGGGGGSAAAAVGSGSGGVPGAEAGYGGSAGISGMGTPGIGAPGVGAPGGPGVAGPSGGGGLGFNTTNALEAFGLVTGVTGNPAAGIVAGGIVGVASGSDFGDMSGDMSGDPTGGNAIAGPDPKSQQKRAVAGLTAKAKPEEGTPSLKDVTPDAKKEEEAKARKRPQTILTSPLGLRSKPSIRRATLLGG